MPSTESDLHEKQPQPKSSHPLPRRASPATSITLRHHRLARDTPLRSGPSPGAGGGNFGHATSLPRESSGDSYETNQSDAKKWFDLSNRNATAVFDNNATDVEPPFFQKESDSSNEDKPCQYPQQLDASRLTATRSSSADDYRSVIDDLTVEIQNLKEELKRYKKNDQGLLRKEKLFEIKIHGLPKRKRRELETTLRDFAASLEDSTGGTSSTQRNKSSRHANRDHRASAYGSTSKHASSSSSSIVRPADSAYATMSIGAHSSGTSLGRPSMSSRTKSSEMKVESYLRDIPQGLYPRQIAMTDKEKKRLVVRRLEQLFTGKIGGRHARHCLPVPLAGHGAMEAAREEDVAQTRQKAQLPTNQGPVELSREALIVPSDQQPAQTRKDSRSRDNGSASNSNDYYQNEPPSNSNSGGPGLNPSPPDAPPPPEQRPTRLMDLDPDRVQVPSENMEYIRHLGLAPPELMNGAQTCMVPTDVQADADGWVYLNLLCNMAQLHMMNVTPSFVRGAVSEISTKFQLSSDGRRIRWQGGSDGTRFTSDSSTDSPQGSPALDEETSPNHGDSSRKRQKKSDALTGEDLFSGGPSKNLKFGPQVLDSSETSFHYKPLLVQQESPDSQTSLGNAPSSCGPGEESNVGNSRWNPSGSGTSTRRKRRHDGAIIYYSGAPFCTDLAGDPGDVSPATYMMTSGQDGRVEQLPHQCEPESGMGSARPISDCREPDSGSIPGEETSGNGAEPATCSDYSSTEVQLEAVPTESGEVQHMAIGPLEPCGLGGVLPDDHFRMVVTTKRPSEKAEVGDGSGGGPKTVKATDSIISRLSAMSTSSPTRRTKRQTFLGSRLPPVEIEYVSGFAKRLVPVPLPPPVVFVPPIRSDSSSDENYLLGVDTNDEEAEQMASFVNRPTHPQHSNAYPDGVELSSGDEDGEESDEIDEACRNGGEVGADRTAGFPGRQDGSRAVEDEKVRERGKYASEMVIRTGGSSAATAGGVRSGYSRSEAGSG